MAMIIGIEKVDYVSKKTGNQVNGYRVHATDTSLNVIGETAENVFINGDKLAPWVSHFKDLKECLGLSVRFLYNRFGSCDGLEDL